MGLRILIVSYVFPPYPGIGGRRWVKFAKYLTRLGHEVHVICAANPHAEVSTWNKDAGELQGRIQFLEGNYPKVLSSSPKSFWQKLQYKLALSRVKRRSKGNFYDRGQFWKDALRKAALACIRQNQIQVVIGTGAPFHSLPVLCGLKQDFPGLKVVSDLRDPWTDNREFFGMGTLTPERKKHEEQLEAGVMKDSDWVLTVAEEMTQALQKRHPSTRTKILTLPNGYDPEDFPPPAPPSNSDPTLRLVFTGSIYPGTDYLFLPLFEAMEEIRTESPGEFRRFRFDFFGSAPDGLVSLARTRFPDSFFFHGNIPLADVYQEIGKADAGMLFLNKSLTFSFSTKFFEYLSQGRKIIVFSARGPTSDFVVEKEIGYAISPETMKSGLLRLLAEKDAGKLAEKSPFDPTPHSLPALTQRLSDLLFS